MVNFRQAYQHKQRVAKGLLRHQGIHGVGVGFKDPAQPNKGAAVIIYASAASATRQSSTKPKRKQSIPLSARAIRSYYDKQSTTKSGVPIRIVRSKRFTTNRKTADESLKFRRRIRPVIAGYSVGTIDGSGTAGLIVSPRHNPHQRYILSNNHVLVNNNSTSTSETLQPGGADGGLTKQDRIGYMNQFVKLRKKSNNYIDAATSKPLRRSLLKPRYAVFGIVPNYVKSYKIGDKFKKVGRTTGVRNGTVESIHTDVKVNYGDYGNLGAISFKNQSIIRGKKPVSLEGDSGSVWLTKRGNYAAAVNFAGSENGHLSISYPIDWFMQVFKAQVAKPGIKCLNKPSRGKKQRFMYVRPLSSKALKYNHSCICHSSHRKVK